jgi:hypothetical protein
LWTSFDNIYDTQEAIQRFKVGDTGKLGVFGLLQAMAVQQDAIMHLQEAVGIEPTRLTDMPALQAIRDVRDETIGHPTSTRKEGLKSNYAKGTITYSTMWAGNSQNLKNNSLEYYVWSSSGPERKSAELDQAIVEQELQLNKVLQEVIDELTKQEKEHKLLFKDSGLKGVFKQVDYYFSKLYSYEQTIVYSRSCFRSLKEQYEEFKKGILQRYGKQALNDSQAVPGIFEECKKLDQVMDRIEDRIMLEVGVDELELDIYIESAQNSFKQLENYAQETDNRFQG